jgi:hypothetical protein
MRIHCEVEGGKYTIVQEDGGELYVLRDGERWLPPPVTGSKMLIAMAGELEDARRLLRVLSRGNALRRRLAI